MSGGVAGARPAAAGRGGEPPREADPVGPERIGAYLARQRELRGISREDLASQLRIPLRSLQRLEAGAFDHEPDGFARGFVRTVAIALGLPPDETIARMLPEASPHQDGVAPGALARLVRAVAVAAVLGAIAASTWMWLASGPERALAPSFQAREDGLVVRRDAVRALAVEHGLLAARAGSGTIAPLPAAAPGGGASPSEPAPDAAPATR